MTTVEAPIAARGVTWLTEAEVSEHTKIPVATLQSWRRSGAEKILPFTRIGRLVRYDLEAVDAALRAMQVEVAS